MIDRVIGRVPRSFATLDDFPYLKEYYDYIIDKMAPKRAGAAPRLTPRLIVHDTPNMESLFLDSGDSSAIIFDVGASSLVITLNEIIQSGEINRKQWLSLLQVCAHVLIKMGLPGVGIALALNKGWDLESELRGRRTDKPLVSFRHKFADAMPTSQGIEQCQEMFVLAHEVTHFYASQGMFCLDETPRVLHEQLMNGRSGSISNWAFFSRLLSFKNETDDEFEKKIIKLMRRELFSPHFHEEIVCDLRAAELTLEYFTWDFGEYSTPEVSASIQNGMHSILLANELKRLIVGMLGGDGGRLLRTVAQLKLRAQIVESFLYNNVKKFALSRGSERDAFAALLGYDVGNSEVPRKTTKIIATLVLVDIVRILLDLEEAYAVIAPYITEPEAAAMYYLSYDNDRTRSKDFLDADGSVFARNPSVMADLRKRAKVNLYKISKETKSGARMIMNEPTL